MSRLNLPRHPQPKTDDYVDLRDLVDRVGYQAVIEMVCELAVDRVETLRAAGGSSLLGDTISSAVRDIRRTIKFSNDAMGGV